MLGLLFWVELFGFFAFIRWQYRLPDSSGYKFFAQQWVIAFAAMTATLGWSISAWVAIKNSVKQHTINTLLQSRLSMTYMEYADKVNDHFGKHQHLPPDARPTDATSGIDRAALRYILNYFEYIALGIRHGDLHEGMLQGSLYSIMGNTTSYSRLWIDSVVSRNARAYSNLRWLMQRWYGPEGFKPRGAASAANATATAASRLPTVAAESGSASATPQPPAKPQ